MRENYASFLEQAQEHGQVENEQAFESIQRQANEEAAMLAERLPEGTPEDQYLVTSPPLLREVRRKLVETFGFAPEEAAQRHHALAAITTVPVSDFNPTALEPLAPDRDDDFVLHTAFEGSTDFVITEEKALLSAGEGTEYERRDGRSFRTYSFEAYAEMLETSAFSLSAIPEILSVSVSDVRIESRGVEAGGGGKPNA